MCQAQKEEGRKGPGENKALLLSPQSPPVFLLSISPFETLGSRHSDLRSGVILFIYFYYFFVSLAREEKKRKTDYTDKGRGHDRRLAQWPQSTRLLPMWSMWCHVWIEFVIGSFLYSERFFSSPQKSTFPNSNSIWNARTHLNVFLRTLKFLVGKQISIVFFRRLPRRLSLNNIQLSPEGEVNGGKFLPKTWSVAVNIERCSPTLRGIVVLVFTKSVEYIWWRKQLFVN